MLARLQGTHVAAPQRIVRRALAVATLAVAVALTPTVAQARDPITPLSDIHRGLLCTARTVVQGTDIASFDVEVLDVVADADGTGPRILVRVSGPAVDATGVAEGFSGSPVYCPDANGQIGNAGAISATVGQYGESIALVTPIELMLGLRVHPPSSVRQAPELLHAARALATPLTFSGLAPSLVRVLQQAAAKAHRTILAAPAGPLGTFAPQTLVPGASVSVMLSNGAVTAGGIGTVTYRDGATLYAFGHPMDGAGRRALMLGDGYVFTVIGNPLDTTDSTSYKLAAPGHVLGTLSNDALDGVVGTVGAPPPTIPVTVTVRDRDRHRTLRQVTNVADETDVGNPAGGSALSEVAPVAVAEAVINAFDGSPGEETGQLCLHVHLREASSPLRFCKRYVVAGHVSTDVPPPLALTTLIDTSQALAEVDMARFARLHVTEVTAGVTIERGLRLGTILGAHSRRTVRPGHSVPIALRVRVAHGPLRTIRFRLAIPRDAAAGVHTLRLVGTQLQGSDGGMSSGVFGALLSLFGDSSGTDPSPAQTLGRVAAYFSSLGSYDGVTAKLAGDRFHAYRDPRMRLDGSATLTVRVAGHNHGAGAGAGLPVALRKLLGV